MTHPENLHIVVQPIPDLTTAIANWLAARSEFKKQANDKTAFDYNATWFALGAAWAVLYPDAANSPGAFERFQRGLIASNKNE